MHIKLHSQPKFRLLILTRFLAWACSFPVRELPGIELHLLTPHDGAVLAVRAQTMGAEGRSDADS